MKVRQKDTGFTLIELMVVVGVVGLVAVTATSIFFTVSRSQRQSELVEEMKQDGNFSLTIMSKMIRQAVSIDCPSNHEISLTSPDGNDTSFVCDSLTDSIASSSANSVNLIEAPGNYEINCDNFVSCGSSEVEIDFQLESGTESTALPYQQSTLDFNTTVAPRNLR